MTTCPAWEILRLAVLAAIFYQQNTHIFTALVLGIYIHVEDLALGMYILVEYISGVGCVCAGGGSGVGCLCW